MRRLAVIALASAVAGVVALTATPALVLEGLQSLQGAADTPAEPTIRARRDIPPALLPHYQQAPACKGLPWQIVAAIGAIESDHGRDGGARLNPATGEVTPHIIGAALNGNGYAAVPVPPGGSPWHTDPRWDHAVGPMQFLTDTWAAWGIDGSGDQRASPHNAYDAIATAGHYLCDHRPRIDSISAAVLRYNPSRRYLADVLATAYTYGMTRGGEPAPAGPATTNPAAGGPVVHGEAGTVLRFALAQLGKPYRWGAAGPNAYDCSGLTLAAYATIGVTLPHYAAYQAGYGQPIDWRTQRIHPGDLLFLRGGDPVHDFGHVGIALDSQRWINAPQANDFVQIGPLPYSALQAVRRLLLP